MPKHVVVHYIVIKYTSCDTVVFDYIQFSNLHPLCIIKVKQSRYWPGVAQRVPGIKVPRFHDNGTGWW